MNIPLDSPPVYATTYMAQSMSINGHLNCKGDKRSHNGFNTDDAKPFLIGVAGGTASGKSSVCKKIVDELGMEGAEQQNVRVIGLESFYKELTDDEKFLAEKGQFDFDHPKAFDLDLMTKTIKDLKEGIPVDVYKYNHITCSRERDHRVTIEHADVILVEGILVFYWEEIRNLFNMRLFVDADADTRLSRRVKRNMQQYKRPLDQILMQYLNFVKPAFEEFCLPTKKYADVIIPRGADNTVAVDVIVQHIKDILKCKGNEPPPRKRHASHEYIINF